MTFQIIAGLCILFVAVFLPIWVKKQEQRRIITLQLSGIELMRTLRQMLSLLQKHRGLTSAYINGSTHVEADIAVIQSQADRMFHELGTHISEQMEDELWNGIYEHWKRLEVRFRDNSVENNLSQHGNMIQNLLYLMDDVADSHYLVELSSNKISNVRLIWKELLTSIECIGQLRAMGSAVLAKGHCNSVTRIRLQYLLDKIQSTSAHVYTGIPDTRTYEGELNGLIETAATEIIQASSLNRIDLASDTFFNSCTKVMDKFYNKHDELVDSLIKT